MLAILFLANHDDGPVRDCCFAEHDAQGSVHLPQ
jgi:hypothetical protein